MRTLVLLLMMSVTGAHAAESGFLDNIKTTIQGFLGRPYVWGATGYKAFDCSGFVWRIWADNGVLIKRTTARKLYMSLPKVKPEDKHAFGTLVFFDNMAHVGVMNSPTSFYHAQTSKGTNLSEFTPFWQNKVCGYRRIATVKEAQPAK